MISFDVTELRLVLTAGVRLMRFFESEPQYDEEYYGGSPGILSGVLRTAVGVALGNKFSENSKQNYLGSPNCERAKTGRKSSFWGCGLSDHCTMYDKY